MNTDPLIQKPGLLFCGSLSFRVMHPLRISRLRLEPIHKVVEAEESAVIPSLAPVSLLRGVPNVEA